MNDRGLLEFIASQVGILTENMVEVKQELNGVKTEVNSIRAELNIVKTELNIVKTDLKSVKNSVTRIEYEHGKKLDALFDGLIQNTEEIASLKEDNKFIKDTLIEHDLKIMAINRKIG